MNASEKLYKLFAKAMEMQSKAAEEIVGADDRLKEFVDEHPSALLSINLLKSELGKNSSAAIAQIFVLLIKENDNLRQQVRNLAALIVKDD